MFEMQILNDEGEWVSIRPSIEGAPPYRYDYKQDAERMLDRLYPDLPADRKRAVRVLKS